MIELPAALGLDGLDGPASGDAASGDSESGAAGVLDLEAEETPDPLPEGYYAANFLVVVETVAERYGDLLDAAERGFIDRLRGLSAGALRLYVRLVMRKGPLFRRDLLAYEEIPGLDGAVAELVDAALMDGAADATAAELLALLRRGELEALIAELGLPRVAGRRGELVGALLAHGEDETSAALRARYRVVRPLGLAELWLVRLLFFGNLEQDWREFVLRDLGVQRYEPYPLGPETRLFADRGALLETLDMGLARLELRALFATEGGLEASVELARRVLERRSGRPESEWHPQAWRHGERILAKVGRELERRGRFEESLELYTGAGGPPSRERRCRVLARLGEEARALELCLEIDAAPRDETEAAFAPFFAHRLRRALGETSEPWRRPKRPKETLEIPAAVLEPPRPAVEWLTLALLEERGRKGLYSENWLWRSLFGLAFWDLIFEPLPGAFAHPFQFGPLDLHVDSPGDGDGGEFFRRRRAKIEARLAELRNEEDLESRLAPIYEAKHGTANAFVAWHPQLEASLRFAFDHVPGSVLATVAERLARDPRRHRRGLPDLLVLSDDSPVGLELLEVKAPGDQLRPEQGAWIDYLNARGVPAKVLRLVATDA